MKSLEEIRDRIKLQIADPEESMMIAMCNYHPLMPYVSEFIKEGHEADPLTKETIIDEMREYMSFAFEKAYGCRGISASRSQWKYVQWLWVLEDEELVAFAEDEGNYAMYAIPILRKICERYGFEDPHPDWIYLGDEMWGKEID